MSSLEQLGNDIRRLQELARGKSDQLLSETSKFISTYEALVNQQKDAVVAMAIEQFNEGNPYASEQLCRLVLHSHRKDIKALHLLATIAAQLGHHEDAVDLLLDCLDLNPNLPFIRYQLSQEFFKSGSFQLALGQCDQLLSQEPANVNYAALRAASLVKLGQYSDATLQYEKILASGLDDAEISLRYGIALRIVGRASEAIDTFRKLISQQPECGEAYWNLANLKVFKFEAGDIDAMQNALRSDQLNAQNRIYVLFSLGKALDDLGRFSEAFQYYFEANELAKSRGDYDPRNTSELVNRCRQTFTSQYFETHQQACESDEPIFIVGLPRSGSTLLEQVLSNHSAIDATMELSEIAAMVRSLNNPNRTSKSFQYPRVLTQLKAVELERLGQEYLRRTQCFRGEKHFFIDKAPHNFLHIGLIRSILPNAKIIDARRNPCACGMSIYKQFFARGTGYAYDLEHIGLYYRDYLQLMNHWHEVLPGKILTVHYENVVNDMEGQVRKILEYCGLPFESQCLEFYKSKRAVATISSEQVRQPVYTSMLEHWKNYEKFLAPLKNALSDS